MRCELRKHARVALRLVSCVGVEKKEGGGVVVDMVPDIVVRENKRNQQAKKDKKETARK